MLIFIVKRENGRKAFFKTYELAIANQERSELTLSEETVITSCSPTLAGLKTGSLFTCEYENRSDFAKTIRKFNKALVPRGLRILPLRYSEKRVLVYVYRPERLSTDLQNPLAAEILSEKEYPAGNPNRCIVELIRRLNTQGEFPHEIGLFLGYPAEDVNGFMKLGAEKAKCVGTWRVYGDKKAAEEKFALYKKCTRVYKAAYEKHNSFERLVVKTR